MDDSYPFITYYEPTMNMLDKLESLSRQQNRFLGPCITWFQSASKLRGFRAYL